MNDIHEQKPSNELIKKYTFMQYCNNFSVHSLPLGMAMMHPKQSHEYIFLDAQGLKVLPKSFLKRIQ